MTTPAAQPEELVGRFDRPIWRAEDDSCIIARVVIATPAVEAGANATVKGSPDAGPALRPGGTYRFHGNWKDDERHGRQFAFVSFSAVPTGDKVGVVAYLISVAENVGEKRAAALWEHYGVLAVTALRENPEAVAATGIMSVEAATEAAESLRREVAFEGVRVELLSLLSGRGFQLTPLIRELLTRWGRHAPQRIRSAPYDLLLQGFPSVGWKRADRLYLDLGGDPAATQRQALCALYHLREHGDGNTWLPADAVGAAVVAAIGERADPTEALVHARDAGLIRVRHDAAGKVWVAERQAADDEGIVADRVKELIQCSTSANEPQSAWPFGRLLPTDPEPT